MRRLVWTLVVLVALLAILDRVALAAAEHDVAERLQADAHLQSAPDVSIHGYPFLTQLIGGDYDDVDVVSHDLTSGDLRIDRLSVHVSGAHVSIGDVLTQARSRVRVDRATAELFLTYDDVHARSPVTGVSVSGGDTVLLETKLGNVPLKLNGLPFDIRLTSAKATQAGVTVTGVAERLTLRT